MRASTTSGDEVPPNSSALRRVERHAGGQSSPGAGTGMDLERAAERFHALHHAEQPEALTPRGLDVESHAIVADGHREPVGAPAQAHRHLTRLAVLDGVLYSFLNDPEQAQHQIWRQRRWHVVVAETGADSAAGQIAAKLV